MDTNQFLHCTLVLVLVLDEEYLTIRHGKLDRKTSEYMKETNYEKNDLE